MDKIEDYMSSNLLQLNRDKTQFLVITNNPETRKSLHLEANPENILSTRQLTYLEIEISDDCKWNYFLQGSKKMLCKWYFPEQIALWGRTMGWCPLLPKKKNTVTNIRSLQNMSGFKNYRQVVYQEITHSNELGVPWGPTTNIISPNIT